MRIVLDPDLITVPSAYAYEDSTKVILSILKGHPAGRINEYLKVNKNILIIELNKVSENKFNLKELFAKIGEMDILSVLIESGPLLAGELVKEKPKGTDVKVIA